MTLKALSISNISKSELLIVRASQPAIPSLHQFSKWQFFQLSRPKTLSSSSTFLSSHIQFVSNFYHFYQNLTSYQPLESYHVIILLKPSNISLWPHPYNSPCSRWSSHMDLLGVSPKSQACPYLRPSCCWHPSRSMSVAHSLTSFQSLLKNQLLSEISSCHPI